MLLVATVSASPLRTNNYSAFAVSSPPSARIDIILHGRPHQDAFPVTRTSRVPPTLKYSEVQRESLTLLCCALATVCTAIVYTWTSRLQKGRHVSNLFFPEPSLGSFPRVVLPSVYSSPELSVPVFGKEEYIGRPLLRSGTPNVISGSRLLPPKPGNI